MYMNSCQRQEAENFKWKSELTFYIAQFETTLQLFNKMEGRIDKRSLCIIVISWHSFRSVMGCLF